MMTSGVAAKRPYRCKRHGFTDDYRVNRCGSRTCRTCERDRAAIRRSANSEQGRARTRRWRANHLEQARASGRQSVAKWRAANPETAAEYVRAAYRKNNDAWLRGDIKRRRLMADTVNDLTTEQWEILKRLCAYRCGYCGERKPLERDHVIPVSKGGAHTLRNIIPSCIGCNRSKSNKLGWEANAYG